MGKNKGKHKNKDACEFVLVNRGMDDPNFNNPNASERVLLYVPKEEGVNKDHERILNQIPDVSRGLYGEETIENNLKDLGVSNFRSEEELKQHLDEVHKEKFIKKVNIDLGKNEVVQFVKNSKIEPLEEVVDTSVGKDKKKETKKEGVVTNINQDPEEKKIEDLLKKAKIAADITEYNKFGLKKDINPEVLEYVTDKAFVEGVDIFIPASGTIPIDHNRFDIDIPVEKMDENYKEVYEAMKSEDEEEAGEELEDNFILLANEGVLPIELDMKKEEDDSSKDKHVEEFVITETKNKKTPSYKYITKEEQEMLDKQFANTYNEYYSDVNEGKSDKAKNTNAKSMMEDAINELTGGKKRHAGLTKKFEDEEEFEDYEYDEEGDMEADYMEDEEGEFEEFEEEEKELEENVGKDEENKIEYCENNFKIEYVDKNEEKKTKKGKMKKNANLEEFTVRDLDKLIHNHDLVSKTMQLFEGQDHDGKDNEEEEGLPIFYPKKRLNITSVHGRIGNLPKTIGLLPSKKKTVNEKASNEEGVIMSSNRPLFTNTDQETKEEKNLRKKLLKEEKKEKRKQKKDLKAAFKAEKCKQMKQIANTNQVIRFGLSVRDV